MTETISVNERTPDSLRAEVGESRSGLVDKLETLQQGIKDTWHGASETVTDTVENVQAAAESTMHAVQTAARSTGKAMHTAAYSTGEAMQTAAHSTGEAMGRVFDLPSHVRRVPWLMVSGAMVLGVATGYLIARVRN